MTHAVQAPDAPPQSHGGMLAIWHDVAPGAAAAVRDWYAREHHFERLAIPGFLQARRFEKVAGEGAEFLGLYRVSTPDVLRSSPYRARVNAPTAWTKQVMPSFRAMCRTVCRIAAQAGRAQGGHLAAIAGSTDVADLPGACARLQQLPGVLQVTAIAADDEPAAASSETRLRGGPDACIAWALLADTDTPHAAEAALAAARALLEGRRPAQAGIYRLAFSAHSDC
jgi:hypothetical protein